MLLPWCYRCHTGRNNALREEVSEEKDLLTVEQIQQLQLSGNNATIFIHGYNVPMGEMGSFGDAEDWGKKPPSSQRLIESQRQKPFLHHTVEETEAILLGRKKLVQQKIGEIKKEYAGYLRGYPKISDEKIIKVINKQVNGTGTYHWLTLAESYLNRAAANLDDSAPITDWEKYNRIIGVAWTGDASAREFFKSILNGNLAARRFAKILRQFIDAGITVNIITHSLGARVALGAMNILGDFAGQYDGKVDNVFLWEPAVADNALTNDRSADKGPLKETVFPFAYKVAKHISVLYSNNDGVLGGDNTYDSDIAEKFTSAIGGAYPKRYWWIASGTEAMGKYYDQLAGAERMGLMEAERRLGKQSPYYQLFDRKMNEKIAAAIRTEAAQVNADSDIAPVYYLSPWAHYRRFEKQQIDEIIKILQQSKTNDWDVQEYNLRPALGHVGFEKVINDELEGYDEFIAGKYEKEFGFKDQSKYFMSHSALRLEYDRKWFPQIFEESYKQTIMDNIKEKSKFGKY